MTRQGKRAVFEAETIKRAEGILNDVPYNSPIVAAVSVLLAGKLKLTSQQIGTVLGVSEATVIRMNQRFRQKPESKQSTWGGRRHGVLTSEDEAAVLKGLTASAAKGEIVGAKQIKIAIEKRQGKRISLQTAYNCLHRAGWRKVVPDKVHPKADPERQDEFKKKCSRRPSSWLPPKRQSPGGS